MLNTVYKDIYKQVVREYLFAAAKQVLGRKPTATELIKGIEQFKTGKGWLTFK